MAKGFKEQGFEVCVHTCENRNCLNKTTGTLLWKKEGSACTRHSRCDPKHPCCTSLCPGHPGNPKRTRPPTDEEVAEHESHQATFPPAPDVKSTKRKRTTDPSREEEDESTSDENDEEAHLNKRTNIDGASPGLRRSSRKPKVASRFDATLHTDEDEIAKAASMISHALNHAIVNNAMAAAYEFTQHGGALYSCRVGPPSSNNTSDHSAPPSSYPKSLAVATSSATAAESASSTVSNEAPSGNPTSVSNVQHQANDAVGNASHLSGSVAPVNNQVSTAHAAETPDSLEDENEGDDAAIILAELILASLEGAAEGVRKFLQERSYGLTGSQTVGSSTASSGSISQAKSSSMETVPSKMSRKRDVKSRPVPAPLGASLHTTTSSSQHPPAPVPQLQQQQSYAAPDPRFLFSDPRFMTLPPGMQNFSPGVPPPSFSPSLQSMLPPPPQNFSGMPQLPGMGPFSGMPPWPHVDPRMQMISVPPSPSYVGGATSIQHSMMANPPPTLTASQQSAMSPPPPATGSATKNTSHPKSAALSVSPAITVSDSAPSAPSTVHNASDVSAAALSASSPSLGPGAKSPGV
ncbi:hypothetical protein FISHEDRAFT_61346 [Fistulina hepatica ATCC 64428]|uniref:Uncharacterized protein n=1 Tax=Fistulina hepatica ATCC 64428 TaxID=1128425 RepID=A0A0D7A352_9AGAR|nr:hypothetical protein FISHEDRAFT_61346 [Fistulina hepatica ATCC 64428]